MKTKIFYTLLLLLLFVAFSNPIHAQENYFRVLGVWGSPSKNGELILPGTLINEYHQIILKEKEVLILEYLKGKGMVHIYTPGTYTGYGLLGQMQDKILSNREIFANLQIGGGDRPTDMYSQERCRCGGFEPIKLLGSGHNFDFVLFPEIYIEWVTDKEFKEYEVIITDMADQILMTKKTSNQFIWLEWDQIQFKDPELSFDIIISLKGLGGKYYGSDRSEFMAFLEIKEQNTSGMLVKLRYNAFQQNYKSLNPSPSIQHLNEALFFESIRSYSNALYSYQKAIAKAENPELYQTIYQAHLKRVYWELYKEK